MKEDYDVHKLISLVKSKESIWNFKSDEYGNRFQRRKDWMSICEELVPNFEEKKIGEKCAIVLEYQNKWKMLRDGFARSIKNYVKKAELNEKGKLYAYYDEMQFLMVFYEDLKEIIENTEAQYKDLYVSTGTTKKRSRKIEKTYKDTSKESSEDELANEPPPKLNKIRNNVVQDNYNNVEEDKQFLLSLLSDFRKIPEDTKLDCKGDIINVIRHYRNKSTAHFETKGSYFSHDIAALATTATETTQSSTSFYDNAVEDSSQDSESSVEIKYSNQ